jgi:hypothetical protein
MVLTLTAFDCVFCLSPVALSMVAVQLPFFLGIDNVESAQCIVALLDVDREAIFFLSFLGFPSRPPLISGSSSLTVRLSIKPLQDNRTSV